MQSLIDAEGGARVLWAVICGFAAKCVGVSGTFYRMAGKQARLIDDVTGTMLRMTSILFMVRQNRKRLPKQLPRLAAAMALLLPTLTI